MLIQKIIFCLLFTILFSFAIIIQAHCDIDCEKSDVIHETINANDPSNYMPICVIFDNIKLNEPCITINRDSDNFSMNTMFTKEFDFTKYKEMGFNLADIVIEEYNSIQVYKKEYAMVIMQINSYINSKLNLTFTIEVILNSLEFKYNNLSGINKKLIQRMHKTPSDLRITLGIIVNKPNVFFH
jgi:hypothetical protein